MTSLLESAAICWETDEKQWTSCFSLSRRLRGAALSQEMWLRVRQWQPTGSGKAPDLIPSSREMERQHKRPLYSSHRLNSGCGASAISLRSWAGTSNLTWVTRKFSLLFPTYAHKYHFFLHWCCISKHWWGCGRHGCLLTWKLEVLNGASDTTDILVMLYDWNV